MLSENPSIAGLLKGTGEKVFFVAMWLVLAISIQHWLSQSLMLITGLVLLFRLVPSSNDKWLFLLFGGAFIFTGTLGLIFQVGNHTTDAIIQFQLFGWWWNITQTSMQHAGITALKAINGLCAIRLAMCCLSFEESMTLAKRCHIPDVVIELMLLSYRYLFGIKKTANEVMMAQRQRLGYATPNNTIRSFAAMLSAVFIKSMRLSMQNYQAMQVRAYHGRIYCPEKWERSSFINVVAIAAVASCFVALSFIRL